jgi:hypothetical protein
MTTSPQNYPTTVEVKHDNKMIQRMPQVKIKLFSQLWFLSPSSMSSLLPCDFCLLSLSSLIPLLAAHQTFAQASAFDRRSRLAKPHAANQNSTKRHTMAFHHLRAGVFASRFFIMLIRFLPEFLILYISF